MIRSKETRFYRAALATLLLNVFSALAQEQAEAPSYRDGESWHFKMIEKGISVQTAAAVERKFTVSFSAGGVTARPGFVDARRMLAIQDERQYLHFPLFVGKS